MSPWLVLAGLGAFHGLNPAMGWLFAVALGMHRKSRRTLWLSLIPIALGHAASVAVVVLAVVTLGLVIDQRLLEGGQGSIGLVDRIANVEAEIGRDLVVARARRVQAACGRADQFGEPALDIHVNVLERALEVEGPLADL